MRNIVFLFCLSLIFALGTSAQKSTPRQTKNIAHSKTTNQRIPADTIIKLERTGCYGTCPAYKVEINANGTLIYEGKNFVKTKGKITSILSQQQLQELFAEIEKAKYFSLRSSYAGFEDGCGRLGDHSPTIYTTIQMNKRKKLIERNAGCGSGTKKFNAGLERITNLENRIDEIIKI